MSLNLLGDYIFKRIQKDNTDNRNIKYKPRESMTGLYIGAKHIHRNINHYFNLNLPNTILTPFAQAMPDEYKNNDPIQAYRDYYNGEKSYFAKCKNSPTPTWFKK